MPRGRPKKAKPEVKTVYALTELQIETLKRLNHALFAVTIAHRSMRHPFYNEVVELDNAWAEFHEIFSEEIHND